MILLVAKDAQGFGHGLERDAVEGAFVRWDMHLVMRNVPLLHEVDVGFGVILRNEGSAKVSAHGHLQQRWFEVQNSPQIKLIKMLQVGI